MTPEETALKAKLNVCDEQIRKAQDQKRELLRGHVCRVLDMEPPTIDYGSASCCVCTRVDGWYCTESPDRVCHYLTNRDGTVTLIDGTYAAPPTDHDVEDEDGDRCVYCGSPENRQ